MSTVQGKKNRESMLQDANFDLWAREVVSQAILERLENASLATKRGPADRIAIFRRWRWTMESASSIEQSRSRSIPGRRHARACLGALGLRRREHARVDAVAAMPAPTVRQGLWLVAT